MHWTLYILAAVVGAGALSIWYTNLQERRADRDLAHKQADTEHRQDKETELARRGVDVI